MMLLITGLTLASLAAVQDTALAPSRCGALPQPQSPDTIDAAVLAWMRHSRTPAASIAIVRGGRTVTERAYGWADLATCVRATPEMRFGIGSITKQITALGVLVLVSQGELALDDSISRWLPEFRLGLARHHGAPPAHPHLRDSRQRAR
jgi:D-alanyl-D-alanine carboxypeptidase